MDSVVSGVMMALDLTQSSHIFDVSCRIPAISPSPSNAYLFH